MNPGGFLNRALHSKLSDDLFLGREKRRAMTASSRDSMDSTDYRSAASLDQDLSELSRTAGHSGMAQAVMRDLSDERKKLSRSLDIDPISASRTPSANREPPLKTRYEEHSFACESCRMAARRLFDRTLLPFVCGDLCFLEACLSTVSMTSAGTASIKNVVLFFDKPQERSKLVSQPSAEINHEVLIVQFLKRHVFFYLWYALSCDLILNFKKFSPQLHLGTANAPGTNATACSTRWSTRTSATAPVPRYPDLRASLPNVRPFLSHFCFGLTLFDLVSPSRYFHCL